MNDIHKETDAYLIKSHQDYEDRLISRIETLHKEQHELIMSVSILIAENASLHIENRELRVKLNQANISTTITD